MSTQSTEDKISRLRAMVADNGQTWDLSENDKSAIQAALKIIDRHQQSPSAWFVSCCDSTFDYLVFTNREDAVNEALRQIENSDGSESWAIFPLVNGEPEIVNFEE